MTYSAALLYYKGFHAIQTQRIAHVLWNSGRKVCINLCVCFIIASCIRALGLIPSVLERVHCQHSTTLAVTAMPQMLRLL